ncbi:AI-2E family transporter [Ohtaekwangia kribbensis]|jgi:predicted PurR-regulated permease PerM|uniref:AI-2E family transporter n=1 Tax=Ohtaekwangia kribbensis TaxID=688913 RepID=A0ABW3K6K8_9BACT
MYRTGKGIAVRANLQLLQYIVYGSVVLFFGRDIFIPISFALLISFILYPVCIWMQRRGMGKLTAIIIALSLLIIVGLLLVVLLVTQTLSFLQEWPVLQTKLVAVTEEISALMTDRGITKEQQTSWIYSVANQAGGKALQVVSNTISASVFSAVMLVLIPVYAILILYYRDQWMAIIYRIFPNERRDSLRNMVTLTIQTYYNFIMGMGIVYLIVGTLNSIGLLLLGVPHAILFGFIASVLTFIPYVGITIGSLLPIAMAWITYDSIWYPVGIIGVFTFVQYLEANVIFPLAVSQRLNVNTFVMLVAIFAGGLLWGMAGMILFVPFVGILKLVADHNPRWKTLSMMLGQHTG